MSGPPGRPAAWGVRAEEWARELPGDELAGPGWVRLVRGASCAAPPERLWPWVCQLRVAPYSYDLLDNLGRRSPRTLTPGLTDLAVGQRIATAFRVVDFHAGGSVVMRGPAGGAFADVVIGYAVVPDAGGSRLLAVLRHPAHRGPGRLVDRGLAWGDLLMMRKQLRTLTGLAAHEPG